MTEFEEIKEPLKKCLEIVLNSPNILKNDFSGKITPWKIAEAVSDKWFKFSDFFDVSYIEGLKIRAYVHESIAGVFNKTPYDYITRIYSEFSRIVSKEDPEVMEFVNDFRKRSGYPPLSID
jgi:hypothetical protein